MKEQKEHHRTHRPAAAAQEPDILLLGEVQAAVKKEMQESAQKRRVSTLLDFLKSKIRMALTTRANHKATVNFELLRHDGDLLESLIFTESQTDASLRKNQVDLTCIDQLNSAVLCDMGMTVKVSVFGAAGQAQLEEQGEGAIDSILAERNIRTWPRFIKSLVAIDIREGTPMGINISRSQLSSKFEISFYKIGGKRNHPDNVPTSLYQATQRARSS